MPLIQDDLEQHVTGGSNFGFSATRIDALGAAEYSLVTLILDESGSVNGFQKKMQDTVKEIVKSCARSPRADNLMLRVLTFNDSVKEFHGFKLLDQCNLADYDNLLRPSGTTALYDATINGVDATVSYSEKLVDADFKVNAVNFVLTDGDDNSSTFTRNRVKEAFKNAVTSEKLESLLSILIGVNAQSCSSYLAKYKDDAGFDQFVEVGVTEKDLAKLAQFVSKSISATSQSLGTGVRSQTISF